MTTCIIIHNMIIENEHNLNAPMEDAIDVPPPTVEMVVDEHTRF